MFLRTAGGDPEAGHDLVKDQDHAALCGDLAQLGDKFLSNRDLTETGASWLQDASADIVMRLQDTACRLNIV